MDGEEQLSITTNFGGNQEYRNKKSIYKNKLEIGIQQYKDQGERQVEGSFYNLRGIFWAYYYVLWIGEFASHFPSHDK